MSGKHSGRDGHSKYWCWTLNNPTITEMESIDQLVSGDGSTGISYVIYGKEIGEKGTPHFQGYLELNKRVRISYLKKVPGLARAHFERRRGEQGEAIAYCKKDGQWFQFGTAARCGRGRRTDLEDIRQEIVEGKKEDEIADAHFTQWVQYRRSFEAYRDLKNQPRFRKDLKVYVLWGESGVGKSSYVYSRFGDDLWISTNPVLRWFDGYTGQGVVLIDDFSGECPFRFLLRLLDVYPLRVEVKGGSIAWNPTKIFITSNKPVQEWYHGERDIQPVLRRVESGGIYELDGDMGGSVEERHIKLDELIAEKE